MRWWASWGSRIKSCSHRKWQTCWFFWLNSLSLFRVVNYLWALKNLGEGARGVGARKINAMDGWSWVGGDGDRKRESREEKGNLRRRGMRISRKIGMSKGILCKYQQAHYHFKTLERKSQKVERSIFLGHAKFILTRRIISVYLSHSFFLAHTYIAIPLSCCCT